MWEFDYLIVGAGFSGLTMAERLITQLGARCLIVEKRDHVGGNAYDRYDDNGVLIHAYGPHYFRTNSQRVRDYLSQFTEWHRVDYKILSYCEGKLWNFPINLNTFEQLIGRESTSEEMEEWLEANRVPIENPKNSEEVIISQVGEVLYEKFFLSYTLKQWKQHPRDLDASVCGRIPIRTNRDDRYLREEFQALPKAGYTRMFERMVDACGDNLSILLKTDYRDVIGNLTFKHLVYSGPIDEFFDNCYGELPYRSLRFEAESFTSNELKELKHECAPEGFWQPAMQVNYPNEENFTRIVEVKHATGQDCGGTTIVREYPEDYGPGKEPYYPVPGPDSATTYKKYKALADEAMNNPAIAPTVPDSTGCERISFVGRLATYRYYNMDQVVGMALSQCDKITKNLKQL